MAELQNLGFIDRASTFWNNTTKLEKVSTVFGCFFRTAWTYKKVVLVLLLAFSLPAWVVNRGGWEVSNGRDAGRAGKVSKFSKKGILPFGIFHTWEGELTVGEEGASIRWAFSCPDQNLVPELKRALDTQSTVRLPYSQRKYQIWWQGDTDYWITGVEAAHSSKNSGNAHQD